MHQVEQILLLNKNVNYYEYKAPIVKLIDFYYCQKIE